PIYRQSFLSRAHIPEFDLAIRAASGQRFAVRGKGGAVFILIMLFHRSDYLPGAGVTYFDDRFLILDFASDCDQFPVRREFNTTESISGGAEAFEQFAGRYIPQRYGADAVNRGDRSAVRSHGDGIDVATVMPGDDGRRIELFQIIDSGRIASGAEYRGR